jgi:hypothetical protein
LEGLVQESEIQRWMVMMLFRLPTTSSEDTMVKPQFARNPIVRGLTRYVFPW